MQSEVVSATTWIGQQINFDLAPTDPQNCWELALSVQNDCIELPCDGGGVIFSLSCMEAALLKINVQIPPTILVQIEIKTVPLNITGATSICEE